MRVLHIAPEPRLRVRLERCPNLTYLTTDAVQPGMTMRSDLMHLALPDGSIDAAICSHVLEHIEDDARALRELFRVLTPGGWVILLVPQSSRPTTLEDPTLTDPKDRERVYGQADHVRLYGQDFEARVRAAGFQTQSYDWRKAGRGDRLGLFAGELVFKATRPAA